MYWDVIYMMISYPLSWPHYSIQQLGILRCGDTMVFYALKNRLHNDPDDRVRYEAAKSLILIGKIYLDFLTLFDFMYLFPLLILIILETDAFE